ncbi:MAG TPA: sodium/sugar symporter [Saprospiraceae bacterium]|nr:sodium/sugar symporter [Saprospiraceae bacterium]
MPPSNLHALDYLVFIVYFVVIATYGYRVWRRKQQGNNTTAGYFLAEGALTYWAIGASLIASNISAEHFIGMSGSGFAIGLAISTYEWMSAATLLVVAVFFIPVYLKNHIYTMPQFLRERYSPLVATLMAVFWLLAYVFVNLTSILYLGALALELTTGLDFYTAIAGLAVFAIVITVGGMRVIGYTDVVQVAVLVLGGLATVWLALNMVAEHYGSSGVFAGLALLREKAPSHFHMILPKTHPYYKDLPGLTVLIGAMWINNLNYWGCNQYIIQRALGADLNTARKGILFAAFLKLLIPVIVVLPGIAAFVLHSEGMFQTEMQDAAGTVKPDFAYPTLLNLLPMGMKGLAFAALIAAIVASLAGKANSVATIFSLDIYKRYFDKTASEAKLVRVGKIAVVVSMLLAIAVAPQLRSLEQTYQFIQEYMSFITPGAFAIFLLGMFWRRTSSAAALAAAVLTIPLSALYKFYAPEIPFLDRLGWVFVIIVALMVVMSLLQKKESRMVEIDPKLFRVEPSFVVGGVIICGILTALYTVFW